MSKEKQQNTKYSGLGDGDFKTSTGMPMSPKPTNWEEEFKKMFVLEDGQFRGGDAIPLDVIDFIKSHITKILEEVEMEEVSPEHEADMMDDGYNAIVKAFNKKINQIKKRL
jgi:hypothetical protein